MALSWCLILQVSNSEYLNIETLDPKVLQERAARSQRRKQGLPASTENLRRRSRKAWRLDEDGDDGNDGDEYSRFAAAKKPRLAPPRCLPTKPLLQLPTLRIPTATIIHGGAGTDAAGGLFIVSTIFGTMQLP